MTTRKISLLFCGIIALTLAASNASANISRCGDHTALTEQLSATYGERRQAMGLAGGNTVIEVYASDDSGSWSITVTKPGGPTCLIAAGEGFRLESPPSPEEDPDA